MWVNGAAPLIAVHPGASCRSKRWPAERFAAVADRLAERFGAKIVVVTGPDEVQVGKELVSRMRAPALCAFGLFSPSELAGLLAQVRLLISNDSGPVHLASAVGTPVVAIFGRWGGGLSPTRWGPTDPKSIVLHQDVGCRPCLAHRCPIGFVCLQAVSVDEVVAAATHVAGLEKI
jgi:heptosyltransferase-2